MENSTTLNILNEINVCSICLASLNDNNDNDNANANANDNINTLPCSHSYHNDCINIWSYHNNTCPICRSEIINKQIKKIDVIDPNQNNRNLNRELTGNDYYRAAVRRRCYWILCYIILAIVFIVLLVIFGHNN